MNVVKVEATQGAAFDLVLQRTDDLSGVTAEGAVVAGNLLDPTVSPMVESGDTLNTLAIGSGLTIDTAAKTITVHLDATATTTWSMRYASLQIFLVPTAATRKEAARVLIEITPDITAV